MQISSIYQPQELYTRLYYISRLHVRRLPINNVLMIIQSGRASAWPIKLEMKYYQGLDRRHKSSSYPFNCGIFSRNTSSLCTKYYSTADIYLPKARMI